VWIVEQRGNGKNPTEDKDIYQKMSLRIIGVQSIKRIGKQDSKK